MTQPMSWHRLFLCLVLLTTSALSQSLLAWTGLQRLTLPSPAMGKSSWGFQVYLPPEYDQTTDRFPVIYVLHGGGSDEYGMGFMAKDFYEPLRNTLPAAILVFPNGGRDSFFLDDKIIRNQVENPDKHLIKELIPFIDANFRTIANRESRSIVGFSMGGFGAYHFAFKYPEVFGAVAALAAGGPYGPQGLITQYSSAEKPQSLAVTKANQIRGQTSIFIAVGAQDLVPYNNEMANILRSQGIPFDYRILPATGHDLGALLRSYAKPMFESLLGLNP